MPNSARAARAVAPWAVACTLPALISLMSIEVATHYTVVLGVLGVSGAAMCLYLGKDDGQGGTHTLGRAAIFFSFFCFLLAIVNAAQEKRRCVTDLCEFPTMYGDRHDCLAPCHTPYAAWHTAAICFSVVATAVVAWFAFRYHNLIESQH